LRSERPIHLSRTAGYHSNYTPAISAGKGQLY